MRSCILTALPLSRHPMSCSNVAYKFRPIVFFMTMDCPAGWLDGGESFVQVPRGNAQLVTTGQPRFYSMISALLFGGFYHPVSARSGYSTGAYWGSLKAHGWTERKQRSSVEEKGHGPRFLSLQAISFQHLAVIQSTCKIPGLSKQLRGFRAISASWMNASHLKLKWAFPSWTSLPVGSQFLHVCGFGFFQLLAQDSICFRGNRPESCPQV